MYIYFVIMNLCACGCVYFVRADRVEGKNISKIIMILKPPGKEVENNKIVWEQRKKGKKK